MTARIELTMEGPSRPAMTTATDQLDRLAIDTIRTLSIDAVQQANSGHPGAPMGAAPMAYTLWTRFLRTPQHDPIGRIATGSS